MNIDYLEFENIKNSLRLSLLPKQCFAAVGVLSDRLMVTARLHQGFHCEQSATVTLFCAKNTLSMLGGVNDLSANLSAL